jgi:TonB-linked SusC/RagA family outer membrane protein
MQRKVLRTFFKTSKNLLKRLLLLFLLSLLIPAVNYAGFYHFKKEAAALIKVSGTVTDEKNKPLEGVNIAVKNGKKGAVTGANGNFSIDVNEGIVLIFSSAGFAPQEVATGNKTNINVVLKEDLKVLDEVVAIGYSRQRKSDLTGSIASVKASELNLSSPTLSQALVGKVAGVQVSQVSGSPYSGTKIRVRGIGSINASSEPLYVIDGYPVGGNVSAGPGNTTNNTSGYNPNTAGNDVFINPDDIESIEILKDAASAAIYGSRASGGVVLITTKRGKAGKGKFEYDYQIGINQLAHKVKLLNADEFAQLFIDGRNNAYHNILVAQGVTWDDSFYADDNATRVAKAGSSNTSSIAILKSIYDFPTQKLIKPQFNTDWQDALYRNALVQRHNLSFSGGKEGLRYAISGGYLDQPGILKPTFQKRINFRANIDGDVSKKLKISSNVAITSIDNREVEEGRFNQGPVLGALVYMPIFPEYNADGSLALGLPSIPVDGFTYGFQTIENPVALAERVNITRKGIRSTYNANATYEILPDLSAKINLGIQTYNEKYEYYYPTNLSSGVNVPGSPQAIAAANASAQSLNNVDKLAEYTLNYRKQFGQHRIDILAGYTTQQTATDIVSVGANGFNNDAVEEITGRGANPANLYLFPNTGKATTTLLSYLGRALYNYNNKYFLSGSIRADGSSRFGPQNRYGIFPSVSAGWNISNESFYNNWLGRRSSLKLRASWGLSGNNNIGNYQYEQLIANTGGVVFGTPGTINTATAPGQITDPKLGWESTSQYNIGTDISLMGGRINVIANYYISKSYNLLYNKNISALSGSNYILTNLKDADIRNKGFDLQVDARIISGKNFNFNLGGNITANKNLVKSLGGASLITVAGAERSYTTHITKEGEPIGMFYGLEVAGMVRESDMANIAADNAVLLPDKTFPKGYTLKGPSRSSYSSTPLTPGDLYFIDKNGDGIINEADKGIIGTPYPKFTYGFNLSLNYKFLDVSASFNGSYGNKVLDGQDYYIRNMEGSGNQYAVIAERYRNELQPGNGHEYKASRGGTQSNSSRLSDYYLQSGSFFRCTNLSLGYNVPELSLIKKAGISRLRIYCSVDNAFTITKYLGYNPEVDYNNGSNLAPGVDYGKYPLVRAYNAGIKMMF